jgi:signal transduction histidine kinase
MGERLMHANLPLLTNSAQDILLKTHSALIHASTEQDIIAALALCADEGALLRLAYMDLDDAGMAGYVTVVANWRGGASWEGDPLLQVSVTADECLLTAALKEQHDPVWFVENFEGQSALRRSIQVGDVGRLVAIKLFGVAHVEAPTRWHGIVCIAWPESRAFTNEEKYIFATICETASAVVSHRRLYLEACGNVRQLRRLNELKTEFLASISHELRTPLVGVLTLSDNILNGVDGEINEEVRTDVDWINNSGQQLLAVINDILDFAKLESGEMIGLDFQQFPISEVIRDAIALVRRTMADAKGLLIEFEEAANSTQVWCDRTRIHQVILNLLSNAVKFSEKGVITVKVQRDEKALVVCVRDEGIGIARDHYALIFEPFQQVDGSLSRKAGGAGLGLSICKRLIGLHGGQIWVTSVPGQGSDFYFSIPRRTLQ